MLYMWCVNRIVSGNPVMVCLIPQYPLSPNTAFVSPNIGDIVTIVNVYTMMLFLLFSLFMF